MTDRQDDSAPTGIGKSPLQVALLQMTSSKSLDENFATLERLTNKAARGGARYVQSPENSLIMDLDSLNVAKVAGSNEYQQAIAALQGMAGEHNIWLHIGATPVLSPLADEQRMTSDAELPEPGLVNRSLLFTPEGHSGGWYDKIHMFDVSLPKGETYRESKNYRPGERAVVVDCGFARLGMTICYDLRFAGLYRQLAQAGAEMISVPAAFTHFTGSAHWHVLLRARAIETGCFVLASAQTGTHETGRQTYGHSLVINPWGEILADAGEPNCIIETEIDIAAVQEARAKIPSLLHDRAFDMDAPL